MSNNVVGETYRLIMEKIMTVSANDFEEGGYDPSTLRELEKHWQENLSKLHVAQMPWDPKPQPPAVKPEAQEPAPQNGASAANAKPEIKYEPVVKQETNEELPSSYANANGYAGSGVNPMAAQRAANNLIQRFGDNATASIQAAGLPQGPRPLSLPGQQRQGLQLPGQGQNQSYNGNGVGSAQTDGASDPLAEYQAARLQFLAKFQDRQDVDSQMEEVIQQNNQLRPLSDDSENLRIIERKAKGKPRSKARVGAPIGQVDGADEDDEDAINSDLDDSEDENEQEEDDDEGPLGEMILCTWDKVNRVKNKWKCTLKDGVLATGGKEYLFHKANGEFEW